MIHIAHRIMTKASPAEDGFRQKQEATLNKYLVIT